MSEIVKLFEYFVTENDIKNFDEFLKDKSLKRDFIQRLIWLKPIRDAGISFTDVKEFVENMEDYKALRSVIKDRPARELIKEELKNAQNRFEVVDTKAEESGRGKADILEGFMPDDAVEEARKIEVNSFANELQRVTLGNDSTEVIKDLLSTLDTVKEMTGGNKEQNNARKIVYTKILLE